MVDIRFHDITNALRTATRIRFRDATNTLRVAQRVRIRDANNVLRTVYQFLAVTLNRYTVNGTANSPTPVTIGTTIATASPVGGTSPFTYAWTQIGTSSVTWVIETPTIANGSFAAQAVPAGLLVEQQFQVAVTDASGAVATTIVNAIVENTSTA